MRFLTFLPYLKCTMSCTRASPGLLIHVATVETTVWSMAHVASINFGIQILIPILKCIYHHSRSILIKLTRAWSVGQPFYLHLRRDMYPQASWWYRLVHLEKIPEEDRRAHTIPKISMKYLCVVKMDICTRIPSVLVAILSLGLHLSISPFIVRPDMNTTTTTTTTTTQNCP